MKHILQRSAFAIGVAIFAFGCVLVSDAHEIVEEEVEIPCDVATAAGTILLPAHAGAAKLPYVVIVGGTLSHRRDGGFVREGAPRDALKRLALALADGGFASLRYDKVGYGGSKANENWLGTYSDEASVAAAAIKFARERAEIGKVAAVGESAGAYLLCIAAKDGVTADAYVFLGGHCDSGEAIYEYNFGRLVERATKNPELLAWAEKNARLELALGRTYLAMFAAAARGDKEFEVVDGTFRRKIDLARRREEIDMRPDEMFQSIKSPALALSGGNDLNVPPDHAARIVKRLRAANSRGATALVIPGVDHNFQVTPDDENLRVLERYSLESFRRNYEPTLYSTVVMWLDQTLHPNPQVGATPPASTSKPIEVRAAERPERDEKTEFAPARSYLAPGIQIVEDIADTNQRVGVKTLEGEIGPLLVGEYCQAHYLDMPAGMYCEEHPHDSESLIYTVRGKWVLCSQGRRHVMQPGTLFRFAANTPTGYEVPFDGNAMILVFKGQRLSPSDREFVTYLQGLADRLDGQHKAGKAMWLKELPEDHPAIKFSREVNPDFRR